MSLLEQLTVQELQGHLALRDLNSRGTKPILVDRLHEAIESEGTNAEELILSLLRKRPTAAAKSIPASPNEVNNTTIDNNSQKTVNNSVISSVSAVESIKAEHARECARAAGLQAKAEFSRRKYELLQEEMSTKLRLNFECEQLDLQGELAEANARKNILAEKQREMGATAPVPGESSRGMLSQDDRNLFNVPSALSNVQQSSEHPLLRRAFYDDNLRHDRQNQVAIDSVDNLHVGESNDNERSLAQALIDQNRRTLLPRSEIKIFDGDITHFRSFIRAFDSRIGNMIKYDEERLHYLEQLTAGKPRDLVSSCLLMDPSAGYHEARHLLESRYGNVISAAAAYVYKIRSWPQIKGDDVEALDEFSIFLTTCRNAMSGLPMSAREVEHPQVMREVLEKLSYPLQDRWHRVADHIGRQDGRPVVFVDLATFVADEAIIAANPLFGRQLFGTPSKRDGPRYHDPAPPQLLGNRGRDRTQRFNGNSQVFHVGSVCMENINTAKCMYCGGGHELNMCQPLEQASSDERWRFAMAKRLCFKCLGENHQIKNCNQRRKAAAANTDPGASSSSQTKTSTNVTATLSRIPNTGMPIVPIKVRYANGPWIQTYAFLDSGSSASFCTSSFLPLLGIEDAPRVHLSLTTLAAENKVLNAALVSHLEISDLDENNSIFLPPVYTIDAIPVSLDDIPNQADVDSWDYLQDVIIPTIHADVNLLIRVNVPTATEPLRVIASQNGGPFAIHTRLGWVLNGPVRFKKSAQAKATANILHLEQLKMHYNHDELEGLSSDELGMSVEEQVDADGGKVVFAKG